MTGRYHAPSSLNTSAFISQDQGQALCHCNMFIKVKKLGMYTGLLSTACSQILLILLIVPSVVPHPCHHLGLDPRPCLSLAPVYLLTSNLEQLLSLCFVFHNCVRLGSPSSNAETGIEIQVDIWEMILGSMIVNWEVLQG